MFDILINPTRPCQPAHRSARWRSFCALLLVAVLIPGCASDRLNQVSASAEATVVLPEEFAAVNDRHYGVMVAQTTQGLLGLFDSKALHALIREALDNNADLNATARRLKATRFLVRQVNAQRLPQAALDFNSQRGNSGDTISSTRTAGVGVSWELDLWNRLLDESTVARLDYRAAANEFLAAQNSIAGHVARSWLSLWALDQVITIEGERISILERLQQTTASYYRQGLTAFEDVGVIRIDAESARADLEDLEEQRLNARRDLEVLLGRYPDASIRHDRTLPTIREPQLVVPAVVLAERPDIQAAFAEVASQSALAKAAYKAMLPSISLGADATRGKQADLLGQFVTTSGWSIVAALTQPLFRGGQLLAAAEARSAAAQASVFDYKQVVLVAMQEVEQALSQDRSLARRQSYYQIASAQADQVLDDYRLRYRNGLADILDLLQVQQQALDLKSVAIQVQAARLDNRIVLGLTLGLGVQSLRETVNGN